nr:repetitive organellar protein-like isoform X29 [Hydra vulgaris]
MFYGLQKEMGILQLCCCIKKSVSIYQSKSIVLKSYKCTDIVIENKRELEEENLKSVSCTDIVIENRAESEVSSNNLNSVEELKSLSCTDIAIENRAESEGLKCVSCADTVIENELDSRVSSINFNSIELKSVSCADIVIENEMESGDIVLSNNLNSNELNTSSCTDKIVENKVESGVSSNNLNSNELKTASCTDKIVENKVESGVLFNKLSLKDLESIKRSDVVIEKKIELEDIIDKADFTKIFVERFYESQLSFTNEIKSLIDKHQWDISIYNKKTLYETSSEYYFVNSFINFGLKLRWLSVHKNSLSIDEKNLIIKVSENVSFVSFHCPCKIENWKPKDNIEELRILMSYYYVSKNKFEECFLPWLLICKRVYLDLHRGTDYISQIYEWICFSNIKEFSIVFRGRCFQDLDELKCVLK